MIAMTLFAALLAVLDTAPLMHVEKALRIRIRAQAQDLMMETVKDSFICQVLFGNPGNKILDAMDLALLSSRLPLSQRQ